jgi:hypothetical protein
MKLRHPALIAAVAVALGAVAAGGLVTTAQQQPPGVRGERARPVAGAIQRPPVPTRIPGETDTQYRQRVLDTAKSGGQTFDFARDTRGKPIAVGEKTIQLPPDAYVEGMTTNALCVANRPCPETPFYTLRRGGSWINVVVRSGAILAEQTAPGEERVFDFLKEALR